MIPCEVVTSPVEAGAAGKLVVLALMPLMVVVMASIRVPSEVSVRVPAAQTAVAQAEAIPAVILVAAVRTRVE